MRASRASVCRAWCWRRGATLGGAERVRGEAAWANPRWWATLRQAAGRMWLNWQNMGQQSPRILNSNSLLWCCNALNCNGMRHSVQAFFQRDYALVVFCLTKLRINELLHELLFFHAGSTAVQGIHIFLLLTHVLDMLLHCLINRILHVLQPLSMSIPNLHHKFLGGT